MTEKSKSTNPLKVPQQIDPKHTANRRVVEFLLRYWLNLRGRRPFPLEKEIDQVAIGDEHWNSAFLIKITPKGYRYLYIGEDLMEAFGLDSGNLEEAEQLIATSAQRVVERFDAMIGLRKPLVDEGEFRNSRDVLVKYRQVLLPIAAKEPAKGKDWEISYILGGMRWKKFLN